MKRALVGNAADPEQVKEAEQKEKRGRDLELDDMATILSMPQGRRFIWRYLEACGVFRTSFTGDNATFYNEGQRNVGLRLLADVNEAAPESYALMLQESRRE